MKIHVLTIETGRFDALKQFYAGMLQVPVIDEDADSFTLGLQQTELEIRRHSGNSNPQYHFAITIPSNKLEEAREWLLSKVALLWLEDYNSDTADFKSWNARSVYFFDPAGNIVELIVRYDLNNPSNEPFSSKQFISVSEIGLAFPEEILEEKTGQLLNTFGLHYYEKQPPGELFKAIGDTEGLFIVVAADRAWYPTKDILAAASPVKIYFSQDGNDGWLDYEQDLQTWTTAAMRFV